MGLFELDHLVASCLLGFLDWDRRRRRSSMSSNTFLLTTLAAIAIVV